MQLHGGYDDGYTSSSCFWGVKPGRLVRLLGDYLPSFQGLTVIDAGCGEAKNAYWLAEQGARVLAVDISELALANAASRRKPELDVIFRQDDFVELNLESEAFEISIAYGLLHCLSNIETVTFACEKMRYLTKPRGYLVVCTFNDRRSVDRVAHPNLNACLLPHEFYVDQFSKEEILYETDEDLTETHPNNNVLHTHSITRLIIRRRRR